MGPPQALAPSDLHHEPSLFLLAQRQPWMTSVPQRQMWRTLKWTVAEALSILPQGGTSTAAFLTSSSD